MDALPPPVGILPVACKFEEIAPELAEDMANGSAQGGYVSSNGPGGKVHLRHPTSPELTWCKWRWTKAPKAVLHQDAPRGNMCQRCTKQALQNASSSSSSEPESI